jgi:hypothetical protein
MPLSVSKKQSTNSVDYRAERGRTLTENDGRGPRIEYLRFVCTVEDNGETRAYNRMNAPRGGPIM